MIRVVENKWMGYGVGKHYIEAAGLSTDTKPSEDLVTGSTVYAYDEVSGTWNQIGG